MQCNSQSEIALAKRARNRKGPQKRWSDEDTCKILNYLLQTIQANAALIYYTKLIENMNLTDVTQDIIKNKVRNLKTRYCRAVEWLNETGQGLLEDNDGKTVRSKDNVTI